MQFFPRRRDQDKGLHLGGMSTVQPFVEHFPRLRSQPCDCGDTGHIQAVWGQKGGHKKLQGNGGDPARPARG